MSTFAVRGYDDAWRVMDLLSADGGVNLKVKFADCFIDIESTARIAGQASAQAFIMLQRSMRQQFSWLKYGKRNARLDPREKKATEIIPHYHRSGRVIRYDVTGPLNAMAGAVEEWSEHGPVHVNRSMNLFAAPNKTEREESWERTVREVAPAYFKGMTSTDKRKLGMYALITVAAVVLSGLVIKETFDIISEPVSNYVQERLFSGKEPTRVATHDGKEAKLPRAQLAEVERGLDEERRRVRMLISDNIEQPLLRFVVAEAEAARPALLAMAPESGMIAINGERMTAEEARAGAKLMRKSAKAKRAYGGWRTEIIPGPSRDA